MLKFKDVPEEQTSEVVRLAAEMQQRDEVRGMEKTATVAAAEEVGISEEYLEKAAQELQIRRIAKAQALRRRNTAVGWIAGAVVAAVGIGFLVKPPPPLNLPMTGTIARVSDGTLATVTTSASGNAVTLSVEKFGQSATGEFFANAAVPMTSLSGYRNVTFDVKGQGLKNIRVDIEAGDYRWKSQNIPVSESGPPVNLSFKEFQRQQRSGNGWKNVRFKSPNEVQRFTIKAGETINSPDASGTVTVGDITFK